MYRRMGSKGRFSNIENAERMILSDNDGRVNMILLDEADVYGVGENLSLTQLRKTVRQCVFPDR